MTVITASPKGFQKLLDLQQQSLTTLTSIQDILVTSKDDVTQQMLQSQIDLQKQMSDTQQKQLKAEQDIRDSNLKLSNQESKEIVELADSLKTWRTFGDDLRDMKKSFLNTFAGGNFSTSLMKALNVGGVFDKKLRREEFIKSQRAMGGDDKRSRKDLEKAFEQSLKISKQIADNEKAIADLKKTLGRGRDVSDDQLASTDQGKALLGKRGSLAGSYAAEDRTATLFGKGSFTGDAPSVALPKTPSDFGQLSKSTSSLALDTASKKENDNETLKLMQAQNDLLQSISDNIKIMASGTSSAKKVGAMQVDEKATGGFMDSINGVFSMMGDVLMNVIGKVFSFKSIMKFVTKFFAPAMIVASLANGIIDGFKTFMDTGSISEALIAGFGGVLEFLSFGLFDKKTVRTVVDAVSGFVTDYIIGPVSKFINGLGDAFQTYIAQPIQTGFGALMDFAQMLQGLIVDTFITPVKNAFAPISDFFNSMVDAVMNTLNAIEIPGVSFKLPFKDDPITVGPWHPFSDNAQDNKNVSRVTPTTGNKVISASKDNEDGKAASDGGSKNVANVVNAPVTNNSNTTQVIKPHARNQESSQSRYLGARY